MSKLAIYTEVAEFSAPNTELDVPCALDQHRQFAERLGEAVLLAHVDQSSTAIYLALGQLAGFYVDDFGIGYARLNQINALPNSALAFSSSETGKPIVEIPDKDFEAVIRDAGAELDETAVSFHRAGDSGIFMDQLGRQTHYLCAFSGIYTGSPMATIIRPIEQGGRYHITNFLYLDREVSDSFTNFQWTVGADMEIIVNTHALAGELLEILIAGGQLAVNKGSLASPDPEALTWHRAAFFARINGGQLA